VTSLFKKIFLEFWNFVEYLNWYVKVLIQNRDTPELKNSANVGFSHLIQGYKQTLTLRL
jgi:hypothetical protein